MTIRIDFSQAINLREVALLQIQAMTWDGGEMAGDDLERIAQEAYERCTPKQQAYVDLLVLCVLQRGRL